MWTPRPTHPGPLNVPRDRAARRLNPSPRARVWRGEAQPTGRPRHWGIFEVQRWRVERRHRALVLGAVAASALGAACGAATAGPSALASPATGNLMTVQTSQTGAGTVLTGPGGRTLYVLLGDQGEEVPCSGGCLTVWPPVTVDFMSPRPGPGVSASLSITPSAGARCSSPCRAIPFTTTWATPRRAWPTARASAPTEAPGTPCSRVGVPSRRGWTATPTATEPDGQGRPARPSSVSRRPVHLTSHGFRVPGPRRVRARPPTRWRGRRSPYGW